MVSFANSIHPLIDTFIYSTLFTLLSRIYRKLLIIIVAVAESHQHPSAPVISFQYSTRQGPEFAIREGLIKQGVFLLQQPMFPHLLIAFGPAFFSFRIESNRYISTRLMNCVGLSDCGLGAPPARARSNPFFFFFFFSTGAFAHTVGEKFSRWIIHSLVYTMAEETV